MPPTTFTVPPDLLGPETGIVGLTAAALLLGFLPDILIAVFLVRTTLRVKAQRLGLPS